MTPYYTEPGIEIYHGDCLEVLPNIPDGSVDMVLTDPPYGTTDCEWDSIIPLEPMWEQLKRAIKPNGAIAMTASQPFTTTLIASNMKMFKYCWVWDKIKPTNMLNASHQPLRRTEDVAIFARHKTAYNPQKTINPKGPEGRSLYTYRRANEGGETVGNIGAGGVSSDYEADKLLPVNIIQFGKPHRPAHPTQKPVALVQYMIRTYTSEGETVLDFTMGSGTTLRAAKDLGRKAIGIEIEEKYCEIAVKRLRQEVLPI